MEQELKLAEELIDFIYESPSAFHAAYNVKNLLLEKGFCELKEEDAWKLNNGGKYFTTKNDSAIIAFVIGKGKPEEKGFKIIGAHTDSPSFRIKPKPEIICENNYVKLNTEVYGAPILNTWFDRPLAIAGRVTLKGENLIFPETKLVNINRPILIIPNLAIHMNKDVNKGVELNRQKDTLPLLALVNDKLEKGNYLLNAVAKEIDVDIKEILDFDLFLYEFEKGKIIGLNNEFISSSRLDDLAMVHAGIKAITSVEAAEATNVMIAFDNEEVGSSTKQGADSEILSNILERIVFALDGNREGFFRAIARSFMISADLAHALHPNNEEKADPINRPLLNMGPVIKLAANQSYTTDSNSAAVYDQICENAGVSVQRFVNRSDSPGGSTIGPISSTHLAIRSVDIGTPVLAMHSVRELGGVKDQSYVIKSFEEFFRI